MIKQKKLLKAERVRYVTIDANHEGQRIDNFLINLLKSVPKSHVYRILRKGEVRVNKRRVAPLYRLQMRDKVRLPPLVISTQGTAIPPTQKTLNLLSDRILYEDENLIIINKPSGMSVHAGSTVRIGVIEAMRYLYPTLPQLELAHRLDSETSGCLILAKKKRILRELHELLRQGMVTKLYWALTKGKWRDEELNVNLPLQKNYHEGGKHVVTVDQEGKSSSTQFKPIRLFRGASLVEVSLLTGRTHQIRVHAAYLKHPIAGDDRYGDATFNKLAIKMGLKRMFLHARSINFTLPSLNQHIRVVAPLDADLETSLNAFAGDKES